MSMTGSSNARAGNMKFLDFVAPILQRALVVAVGLKDYERGKFDVKTQRAYARFQRLIGIAGSDANGVPTQSTLTRLALETQMFKI